MAFSFGTPKSTTGFTLPTATPAAGAGDGSKPGTTGLFSSSLKQPPATAAAPGAALNFSLGQAAKPLTFGTPAAPPSSNTTGGPQFGIGNIGSLGAPGTAVASSTSTTQFGFGSSATVTTSTLTTTSTSFMPISSGTTMTSTAATPGSLSFGLPSTTTAAPKFGTTTVTSSTATGSSAPKTTAPISTIATTNATSTTTPSASTTTESLSFAQLENCINRWTIDLEEQGKFFINQAKQLNAWDTLLVSNGEKILTLNSSIEKVKQQQTQLDQELDFVLAQQKELEDLIAPLEKELADVPVTDMDRYEMYQYSEMIDSQLKQISDDLKEIIESINDATRGSNSKNPVTQIGMILNAHMNSLQWIDRNTTQIGIKLQELTKIEEASRNSLSKSGFNQ